MKFSNINLTYKEHQLLSVIVTTTTTTTRVGFRVRLNLREAKPFQFVKNEEEEEWDN